MWWDCHPTGHWWSNPIGLQIWKSSQHATFHLAALECFTNKCHQRTMEAWTSATKHFGKPSGSTGGSSFAFCPPAPMEHAILAAPSNLNLRPAGIHRLCLKFQNITRCTWTRCRLTEIWKNICRCKTPCADLVQPSQCTGKLQSIWKLQSIFHSFNFYNKCWWCPNKTAPQWMHEIEILENSSTQDGMDQAKWRVPRWHGQRPLKSTQMLQRPQLKVQACWVHGIVLDLFESVLYSEFFFVILCRYINMWFWGSSW